MAASSAAAKTTILTSCSCSSKTSSTKPTRVIRPQSNGIVERWHRTLLDEHFRVEDRRTWFETLEEMQTVLDQYLVEYNTKRPHQGRGMNGCTPGTAFIDGIKKQNTPQPNPIRKAA
jgi:transposase InsO family protein